MLRRGHKPGARRQALAVILRQPLVNPEQSPLLRRGEIGLVQTNGTSILSAPGVCVFVRKHTIVWQLLVIFRETFLAYAIFRRLAVLECSFSGSSIRES